MSNPQTFYTVAQVAKARQLATCTIRRLIKRGEIQAIKQGRQWRIPAEGQK